MPTLQGILETALYVSDIQRAAEFYRRVFGCPTLLESERLIALDVAGRSVLLLFLEGSTSQPFHTPGGTIPPHGDGGPSHFAFQIPADEVDAWRQTLQEKGVSIESEMTWEQGARSLYFRDPDGNLGELITAGFWKFS